MEQPELKNKNASKARWLTNDEAAAHLGIAVSTLHVKRKHQKDFPQPSYQLGRDLPRWDIDKLDAFMNPDANI